MLAALLGALFLLNAVPAKAQTTIWSATLTVAEPISGTLGCATTASSLPGRCSPPTGSGTTALTDYDFTYSGTDYLVRNLYLTSGSLVFGVQTGTPISGLNTLVLQVGTREFTIASSGSINRASWSNSGLSWSVGDTVSVSLSTPPPPTVSLSVSPNPVPEGSAVTVTATLSRTLSSTVQIPVTVTAGSAESEDYTQTASSITISAGTLSSGGGLVITNQDTDEDDETFTVALGTLPDSLTAGTPSSVQITIRDDDGLRLSVKPSHPTPACGTAVTDTCVRPGLALMLTPAPAELTETQFRAIPGGEWKGAVSIRTDGHAGPAPNVTFARLRELFPNFMGYEYRLKGNTGVTARCTWTVPNDPCPEPEPPTTRTPARDDTTTDTPTTNTGGTGTGGGGTPPRDTPSLDDDPTPDSDTPARCGESDREYLESFYRATGGEHWNYNENWNSEEPLEEWFRVGTDEDGEVISLRLADNNLSGDMPTEELLCLNENTELKELALWDNEDLLGEVPEELLLAVERAALRAIAEMLDLNPEWFEDYEDPFDFEDWHEGVTTDDDGRVVELHLPGEIPESIRSQFKKREITITTSSGGCAVGASSARVGASGLLVAVFMLLAVSRGLRARSS